jgi:hypothetical protein
MNTQSIKHNIEIIANVGVLLGIILLAYEVNQNNELLSNQARYNLVQNRTFEVNRVVENKEIAEILFNARSGQLITELDRFRVTNFHINSLINWEWDYEQFKTGYITRDNLPLQAWISALQNNPIFVEFWPRLKTRFTPDFVAFMEENVISQLE